MLSEKDIEKIVKPVKELLDKENRLWKKLRETEDECAEAISTALKKLNKAKEDIKKNIVVPKGGVIANVLAKNPEYLLIQNKINQLKQDSVTHKSPR